MKSFLRQIDGLLIDLQGITAAVSIAVVTCVVCLIVLFRYVLKTDLFGLDEVELLLAFWIYFIGGSFGARYGVQIRADLISVLFQRRPRALYFTQLLGKVITFLIALCFAFWSVQFIITSYLANAQTPIMQLPTWIARLPVAIGLVLAALYLFIDALVFLRSAGRSDIGAHPPHSRLPEYER